MLTLILIVLVIAALFSAPTWPHSRSWGYGPSGGLGLVVILLILFIFYRGGI